MLLSELVEAMYHGDAVLRSHTSTPSAEAAVAATGGDESISGHARLVQFWLAGGCRRSPVPPTSVVTLSPWAKLASGRDGLAPDRSRSPSKPVASAWGNKKMDEHNKYLPIFAAVPSRRAAGRENARPVVVGATGAGDTGFAASSSEPLRRAFGGGDGANG